MIHHVYVCCVFACLAKSSPEIQQDQGSLVQMLLCLRGLLGSDQSAKPLRVVVVCMRIGVSVCVCVGAGK